MTAFEKGSKHLLFRIMRMVTEQQTEHGAFRFVYHRTLNEIKDKLLETTEGDMKYVIIFATMFGDTASPATSMKLFAGAVDARRGGRAHADLADVRGRRRRPHRAGHGPA